MLRQNVIEEGAPVLFLSHSVHPRVLELSTVASWHCGRLRTSLGQSVMIGDRSRVECNRPLHGVLLVWPDATWLTEAATRFLGHLWDEGLCDREAARKVLQSHCLWNDPYSIGQWSDDLDQAIGGLRTVLYGAHLAPKFDVLLPNGEVASSLQAFRHADRLAG